MARSARSAASIRAPAPLARRWPCRPLGLTPGDDNYKIRLDTEPKNTSKQTMLNGRASLDLGGANLVSITSYQDWRFRFLEDLDTLGSPTLLNAADPTSILPKGSTAGGPFHSTNFTQELRLVSSGRAQARLPVRPVLRRRRLQPLLRARPERRDGLGGDPPAPRPWPPSPS